MTAAVKTNDINKLQNGLSDLVSNIGFDKSFGQQLSQTATLIANNRYYLLSNDRNTLTYTYLTHGIVQTMIDQPVEDGFRGGIDISCDEIDAKDISELQNYLKNKGIIEEIKRAIKWARLFGGGGIVIDDGGEPNTPFRIDDISEKTPISFYGADLWELGMLNNNQYAEEKPYIDNSINETPFNFYGKLLNKNRVLKVLGKDAPSFLRPQLRGWGMSELERLIRDLNSYLKNQDVIFELLDEAKIDVYKIQHFDQALISAEGTAGVQKRVQLSNQIKNFQNALVMDVNDDYQQKQVNFAGLAEMLVEIRKMISNSLRMPISKIFGQSITGMNGGEDDIENYNSMIESEIRNKFDNTILQVLKICCKKLFGIVPQSLSFEYKPLRMLSAPEAENVKNQKLNRILQLVNSGLLSAEEAINQINLDNLVSAKIQDVPLIVKKEEPKENSKKKWFRS
jgi:phage-related protein (TIGR01555 family)